MIMENLHIVKDKTNQVQIQNVKLIINQDMKIQEGTTL